jgi:hypothetical protein
VEAGCSQFQSISYPDISLRHDRFDYLLFLHCYIVALYSGDHGARNDFQEVLPVFGLVAKKKAKKVKFKDLG